MIARLLVVEQRKRLFEAVRILGCGLFLLSVVIAGARIDVRTEIGDCVRYCTITVDDSHPYLNPFSSPPHVALSVVPSSNTALIDSTAVAVVAAAPGASVSRATTGTVSSKSVKHDLRPVLSAIRFYYQDTTLGKGTLADEKFIEKEK